MSFSICSQNNWQNAISFELRFGFAARGELCSIAYFTYQINIQIARRCGPSLSLSLCVYMWFFVSNSIQMHLLSNSVIELELYMCVYMPRANANRLIKLNKILTENYLILYIVYLIIFNIIFVFSGCMRYRTFQEQKHRKP